MIIASILLSCNLLAREGRSGVRNSRGGMGQLSGGTGNFRQIVPAADIQITMNRKTGIRHMQRLGSNLAFIFNEANFSLPTLLKL